MGKEETALVKRIQIALALEGVKLFRNHVGALFDANGRMVKYGLGTGSSDLIGWRPVGELGQFVAIEVKTETGVVSKDQELFIEAVNRDGGLAFVARSVEEAIERVKNA